jgi:hypothetical protein
MRSEFAVGAFASSALTLTRDEALDVRLQDYQSRLRDYTFWVQTPAHTHRVYFSRCVADSLSDVSRFMLHVRTSYTSSVTGHGAQKSKTYSTSRRPREKFFPISNFVVGKILFWKECLLHKHTFVNEVGKLKLFWGGIKQAKLRLGKFFSNPLHKF